MNAATGNGSSAIQKRLSKLVKDPAFPGLIVLIILLALNYYFQNKFFSYRILRSNFMAYTPLILAAMAQATIIISGSVDFSIGMRCRYLRV